MSDGLARLESEVARFQADADPDGIDPGRLAVLIDGLQGTLSTVLHLATTRGDHLLAGQSPCTWAASQCRMSKSSAADRLCVGEQLPNRPQVRRALSSGQVGYQSAAVICHLSDQLGDKRDNIDEAQWIAFAQRFSIKELRYLALEARAHWDPDGAELDAEEKFELRSLDISETLHGMYRLDGWLDPVGGAAFKAAIESLSRPLGSDDTRSSRQRRADAAVDIANGGGGGRAQISVQTTVESLKGELGAPAAHLQNGMPICNKTVQRLGCDGVLHRVLKADSMVIDVGRAKRTAQPAHWRGLRARYSSCAAPGCDRPLNMTQAHHVDFWEHGGHTNLRKMLPLCYFHHRLVHEGGWQVVMAGDRFEWIAPDRPVMTRRRWGESRWAA